ncbi:MAG TPA: TolC family protein [Acidobacteriaceae bacterium]|nr:TolC family protein [Acidobacteriaceae bacterium]
MSSSVKVCLAACAAAWLSSGLLMAQTGAHSSADNPLYGSVTTVIATDEVKQLSLDDAIRMGVEHNLAIVEARAEEKRVRAQELESLQPLLPTVMAQADQGAHQFNLAAQGFSPHVLGQVGHIFPGLNFSQVSLIVKVDTTDAFLSYSQSLFNLSVLDNYRAAKANSIGAYYNTQSSRGLVVLNVGAAYLEALAAGSQVDNARSLLRADQLVLDQTVAQHQAGTAANLDELRARVQFQTQEQAVTVAENNFEKAKIALNREIGLPAEQKIQLTDAAPYSELAEMEIQEARSIAYKSRQDYQGIQARIHAAELQSSAAKWERLPSLDFNGNYGVTGVTHGLYHGTFAAIGSINVPIFQEARIRGDREVASANLSDLREQFANLKAQIDQQLRDSLLDVRAAARLVRVAQSNVSLARRELEQTTERFQAGVEDNLPVVQAQATLAGAESTLVDTTVQFNQAKLGLARNLGIVDTQYKTYLHGK